MILSDISGIIFDYGGTIDAHGDHWSEIIYDGYKAAGFAIDKELFKEAYVHAERTLAKERHIFPQHNFGDLMRIKIAIEFGYLENKMGAIEESEKLQKAISDYCYEAARKSVEEAKPVLEKLRDRYPLVLVSNFYGNIESVLIDFGIRNMFKGIIESAMVGVRKPDPKIFELGAIVMNVPVNEILVVGDSYAKDIRPATSIGCKAVWIKGRPWNDKEETNEHGVPEIDSLDQLLTD